MRNVSIKRVEEVLAENLRLKAPEFRLKRYGPFINGHVISPSFRGKRDRQRLTMMWNALEREWGEQAKDIVGMVFAYTPQEWYVDDEAFAGRKTRTAKAG